MGEIPIFTSKAHVFVIDPHTKKSWLPASKSAAAVNFFFDSSRNCYRIISVEGSNPIINSTVTSDMVLTKTSDKFGQWADLQTNIVYGLGFASEHLLMNFAEQFDIVKEKAGKLLRSPQGGVSTHNGASQKNFEKLNEKVEGGPKSSFDESLDVVFSESNPEDPASTVKKLKSLNEKLRVSLAQSSSNVSRLERELSSLKKTNLELTSALQDTMRDGNQWHAEMIASKEENAKFILKLSEMEEHSSRNVVLSDTVEELKKKNDALEKKQKEMSQECNMLQQRVGVLSVVEKQHNDCATTLQKSYEESQQLRKEVANLHNKLSEISKHKKSQQKELHDCCSHIVQHLTAVTELTQKLQLSF